MLFWLALNEVIVGSNRGDDVPVVAGGVGVVDGSGTEDGDVPSIFFFLFTDHTTSPIAIETKITTPTEIELIKMIFRFEMALPVSMLLFSYFSYFFTIYL